MTSRFHRRVWQISLLFTALHDQCNDLKHRKQKTNCPSFACLGRPGRSWTRLGVTTGIQSDSESPVSRWHGAAAPRAQRREAASAVPFARPRRLKYRTIRIARLRFRLKWHGSLSLGAATVGARPTVASLCKFLRIRLSRSQ